MTVVNKNIFEKKPSFTILNTASCNGNPFVMHVMISYGSTKRTAHVKVSRKIMLNHNYDEEIVLPVGWMQTHGYGVLS